MHQSVLLKETVSSFEGLDLKVYVDGTLGAGGHAFEILKAHPEISLFIGIDQDESALEIAKDKLFPFKDKIELFQGNFFQIKSFLAKAQVEKVDGILVDLGVSMMQLRTPERGFSFIKEGPLDMRMDQTKSLTAAEIVNEWSEEELGEIFYRFGEEKKWRKAAKVIVERRKVKLIETTSELTDLLRPYLEEPVWKKASRTHPLTKIFQALRIAVNQELEVLEQFLPLAVEALQKGGRLAVITFHSLEDRIVKHFFQYAASDKETTSGRGGLFLDKIPIGKILTKKPLAPTEEEIALNPSCRSAKLRVFEKL